MLYTLFCTYANTSVVYVCRSGITRQKHTAIFNSLGWERKGRKKQEQKEKKHASMQIWEYINKGELMKREYKGVHLSYFINFFVDFKITQNKKLGKMQIITSII